MRSGESRVDRDLFPGTVDIGPADAVRGGQLIDLPQFPRLTRIPVMVKNADFADALRGVVRELPRNHDFRDAIGIDISSRAVDGMRKVGRQHVSLPARVLEPYEIKAARGERDDIGFAVMIEIDHDGLIAAFQAGGDGVFGKRKRSGLGGQGDG